MTGDEAVADPVAVIVRIVSQVEQHLTTDEIRQIVCAMMAGRAGRRRLAKALADNPQILRTGRPPGEFAIGKLLLALRKAGAMDVAAPRCSACDRPQQRYLASRRDTWCCTPCFARIEPCAGCGKTRRVVTLDRHHQPRCQDCPDTDGDPIGKLVEVVTKLEPTCHRDVIVAALAKATTRPSGQRRLAWAVVDRPELLTGAGCDAQAPALLRFIDELVIAGVSNVQKPACPRCQRVVTLSKLLDRQRVCRACFARAAAVPCVRCGAVREPAARDHDGEPLCPNCLVRDPVNLEDCVGCGQRKMVVTRDADGPRCMNCRPRKHVECAICGQTAIGEISRATGQPWCQRCQQWWTRCSGCATVNPVRGGTRTAPLCARCVNPDPMFWERCPSCNLTWQLSPRVCQRCAFAARVNTALSDAVGVIRADLQPLHQALLSIDRPDSGWAWMSRAEVMTLLKQIVDDHRPITHEMLDNLSAGKTLDHLRSVLVAVGTLPARDEHLTKLEGWTAATVAARTDHIGRRMLHGYATWHHLRRLRHRARATHVTHLQAVNVRCHITAAVNFLDWLTERNLTLATCTQAKLDSWIADPASRYRDETANFIRWAVKHRHATDLTFGAMARPSRTAGRRETVEHRPPAAPRRHPRPRRPVRRPAAPALRTANRHHHPAHRTRPAR